MAVIPALRQSSRSVLCVIATVIGLAGCSSPTSPTPVAGSPTPPVVNPGPQVPLSIVCPVNITAASTTGAAVPVTFTAPAATGGVAPLQVSCTRPSGSAFAVGATTVQCTATDAATTPASAACVFTVTVTPPIPQLSRTRFLAFGDSMTAGEVAASSVSSTSDTGRYERLVLMPALSYPTQLLAQLRVRYTGQSTALQVINAGSPGEWAEDGAIRLPAVMSNLRPEAVFLLEGVNDLLALGTPGVARASRSLDLMAKEVRGRGARLFIATLPPSRPGAGQGLLSSLIPTLNSAIASTARGEGAILVDLYGALATDVTRYIGSDGVHPTQAGYQKIAETFFAAVRAEFETVPR